MAEVVEGEPSDTIDFIATLPAKRMGAAMLLRDHEGRVLIVEPSYKPYWELPGGAVEADESPRAAARREVIEELGLVREPGRLLAVDWVPPRPGRTEGLMLVFDGGVLSAADVVAINVADDELLGWRFCTVAEAADRLSPLLARRLAEAVAAQEPEVRPTSKTVPWRPSDVRYGLEFRGRGCP